MNAYDCYKSYVVLKLHFTSTKYDYFKYNGDAKSFSGESFRRRNDAAFFYRLVKMKHPQEILLANMVDNPRKWIGEIVEDGERVRREWKHRIQSLSYNFEQEISKLDSELASVLRVPKGGHPVLLREYLAGRVSIETMLIILDVTKVTYKYWNKRMANDLIWKELSIRVKKYKPFLKYEKSKYRKLMIQHFH